jgi:WD40 repeat protein/tetratricopeptide (TPR) repeat protein
LDSDGLVVTSDGRSVRVWDGTGARVAPLWAPEQQVHWSRFSADGRSVATASRTARGTLEVRGWEVQPRRPLGPAIEVGLLPVELALSASGELLAGSYIHSVFLWNLKTGKATVLLENVSAIFGHKPAFDRAGKRLLLRTLDGLRVWDVAGGVVRARREARIGELILWARFTADGGQVLIGLAHFPDSLRVWAPGSPPVRRALPKDAVIPEVVPSPDGRHLLWSASSGHAGVLDARTGKALWRLSSDFGEGAPVFSADGKYVFSSGKGVWDFHKGDLIGPISNRGEGSFSPDGGLLLVVNDDSPAEGGELPEKQQRHDRYRTAQVFESRTGQPVTPVLDLSPIPRHQMPLEEADKLLRGVTCRFDASGKRLLVGGSMAPHVINLTPTRSDADLLALARIHSGRQINAAGASVAAPPLTPREWDSRRWKSPPPIPRKEWHERQARGANRLAHDSDSGEAVRASAAFAEVYHLGRLIALAPRDAGLYRARASAWETAGDSEAALADWGRAVALAPRDAEGWRGRGLLHGKRGAFEEAAANLLESLKREPDLPAAWDSASIALLGTNDKKGRRRLWDDAVARFGRSKERAHVELLVRLAGRLGGPLAELGATIAAARKLAPEGEHLPFAALLIRAGKHEEAIRRLCRGSKPNQRYDVLAFGAGAGPVGPLAAVTALTAVFERRPARAWLLLALAYHHAGQTSAARAACTRSVQAGGGKGSGWEDRIETEALWREVESLLGRP